MRMHKIWIFLSFVFLAAGILICGLSFSMLGFDVKAFNTTQQVTKEIILDDVFQDITITGITEEISIMRSVDGICKVVVSEAEELPHSISVKDNVLSIRNKERENTWFGFYMEKPEITVYLPEDYSLENVTVHVNTGDVIFENLILSGELRVENNTGDVVFEDCDAKAIYAETNLGDITGTVLSDKKFLVKTNMGDVDVPDTNTGGTCELTTNMGDIEIRIP